MPTYSFRCTDRGTFDIRCTIADRTHEQRCPACGQPGVRTIDFDITPSAAGPVYADRGACAVSS